MKNLITCLGLLTCWGCFSIVNDGSFPVKGATDVEIIGHRGFAGVYPENSLIGIKKAIEIGIKTIEIDVQQTKDSVLILMHDPEVNRTTNGTGAIKDILYQDLKKLKLLSKNNRISEESVPTLDTVFQIIPDSLSLLIEIKKGSRLYPNIEKRVIDLIEKHNAAERCVIQSFEDPILIEVNRHSKKIKIQKNFTLPYFADFDQPDFIDKFSFNHRFINRSLVKKLHDKNKDVIVWTVNTPARMEKLIKMGVNGIITDRPDLLKNQ